MQAFKQGTLRQRILARGDPDVPQTLSYRPEDDDDDGGATKFERQKSREAIDLGGADDGGIVCLLWLSLIY
jgi:hypothetical protein